MDFYLGPLNIQGYLYAILNIAAIALIYTACYTRGLADGLDKRAWSVTVLMRFLFLIIGCKLFTISFSEFLSQTYATETLLSQRTLAGGVFLGLSIFSILFIYFRFPVKVFDYALVPVLAGLTIQKIGCFIAGCCYGIPFNGLWSVTYPRESLAFFSHHSHQLISPAAEQALPLHPVQLYEAAGYALCAYFVYRSRYRFKNPGSLFLMSSSLILLTRLATNFFRDPSSYTLLGKSPESLVRMQVTLLLILISSLTLLYFYERSNKSALQKEGSRPRMSWPVLLGAGLIILVTLRWYNAWELLFVLIAFVISLNIHWQAIPVLVRIRSSLLLIPMIVLMAQTTHVKKDSLVDKYNNVKIGFSTGTFANSMTFDDGDGCGSRTRYFDQKQTMVGAGYGTNKTFLRTSPKGKLYMSTNESFYYTFLGNQSETWADDPAHSTDFFVLGGGAQIRQQNRWIGIGVGINVGNLRMAYQNKVKTQTSGAYPDKGYWTSPVLPSGYFRVGPRHALFAEYSYAQFFPSMSPSLYSTLMIGSGLGLKNGTEVKFGTLTGISGMLVSLQFPIGKKWGFESLYHFGDSHTSQSTKQNQISFALEYKIKR